MKSRIFEKGNVKIALPVMRRGRGEILLAVREAAGMPAEIVELRADAYGDVFDEDALSGLLREVRLLLPDQLLLFTFRSAGEGGLAAADAEAYTRVLRTAIRSGAPDLVDVEAFFGTDCPEAPRAVSGTARRLVAEAQHCCMGVVLSNHDFCATASVSEQMRRYHMMEEAGADLAKLAMMPGDAADTGRILAASALAGEELEIPHIAIAMGPLGALSRTCGGIFGSAVSFGCLPGEESAPGQMDVRQLKAELDRTKALRKKLFLTGFMGAGKSSVAAAASAKSGLPLVEMDARIEEMAGQPVKEIFRTEGEERFRDLETSLLASLCATDGAIVSTGGGVVLRSENRALMRALGRVIYLDVSPGELFLRLRRHAAGRPVLNGRLSEEGIRELLAKRRPFYEESADLTVRTDGRDVASCADFIIAQAEDLL